MRDLYRRLGIAKDASPAALEAALKRCDHQSLKADAAAVLGTTSRRMQYDELHALLNDLGSLRVGLGLTHAPHWQGDVASDFTQPPPTVSRQQQLIQKLEAVLTQRQRRWRLRLGLLGVVALLIAAFLLGRLTA
ncbi:hypothetical protein [Salinicola avicenniae]|uniref:hypothetical protein n=1 Tax=Salinicola avicenniae TaxID=2916836 RepID=UPI0020747CD0|nr:MULTISPECIES: hypothetical protein [unclassified Salinicola]